MSELPKKLKNMERIGRRTLAQVGLIAVTAGIGAPAALAQKAHAQKPQPHPVSFAEFSQPIAPRMSRAERLAARVIELRMLKGKAVSYDATAKLVWRLPNSLHRFEYVTDTPLTAKVQGEQRYFTITEASTIDGQSQGVTVKAIPKNALNLGGGLPLPPNYPQPPSILTNFGPVSFGLNDPRPEVTLRLSDGHNTTVPLAQTNDIAADNIAY